MGCQHKSKAKPDAKIVDTAEDGRPLFKAWDMVCEKCGIDWPTACGMKPEHVKKDKEAFEKYGHPE